MFKLVVFSILIACVLAGVVPKPPVAPKEKDESPSVKGVPLNPSAQNQKAADKPEAKKVETNKPEEKSAKKNEQPQASLKTGDNQQKSGKQDAARDSHQAMTSRAHPKTNPAGPAVKETHKVLPASAEAAKGNKKEQGR